MKKEVVKDQELDLSVLTKNQSSDEVVNSLKQQHQKSFVIRTLTDNFSAQAFGSVQFLSVDRQKDLWYNLINRNGG